MIILKRKKAFTLVEIMVTILILTILITISAISYSSSINRAKITSVKANMRLLQNCVELFAINNGGIYPASLEELKLVAQEQNYWKDFVNPFTAKIDPILDLSLDSNLTQGAVGFKAGPEQPVILMGKLNFVLKYAALNLGTTGTASNRTDSFTYYILGADGKGKVILDKEKPFVLTNGTYDYNQNLAAQPIATPTPEVIKEEEKAEEKDFEEANKKEDEEVKKQEELEQKNKEEDNSSKEKANKDSNSNSKDEKTNNSDNLDNSKKDTTTNEEQKNAK